MAGPFREVRRVGIKLAFGHVEILREAGFDAVVAMPGAEPPGWLALSLCRFEALPLSILEAFACGCVVAGFTGLGAREYTTERNGFWAAEDDCLDAIAKLTEAVRLVTAGGPMHSDMLEAAHITASSYSRERLARRPVEFWRGFLAGEG